MNSDRVLHSLLRLLAAVLLLQSVGCAPKIYTSIQKSRPARPEGSPVLVYYISDTLPDRAEVLGRVEIRDNGMSTKCSYPEVLRLAKNEANKAGGNGLILTWHREPTEFGSSCHQIAGDILLMPDSIYKDSYLRNTAMQAYRARYFSIPANTAVTSRPPAESGTTPCTLLVNAGYGFIISNADIVEGVTGNPQQGFDLNAALQWVSRKGLGVGLRYAGYFSSADANGIGFDIRLHYIAPEFVLRQTVGRRGKWAFQEALGVGYARFSEDIGDISLKYSGFGFHADLGVEYKLTRHIGIGIGAGAYIASFGTMEYPSAEYAPTDNAGITRITVNGGLRFYF